eukprot:3828899-Pleurochrysis_carterae.AAC.2
MGKGANTATHLPVEKWVRGRGRSETGDGGDPDKQRSAERRFCERVCERASVRACVRMRAYA